MRRPWPAGFGYRYRMGEAPKRAEGTDLSALIDAIKKSDEDARAPRATVKGMAPLERAPAEPSTDPTEE